ncbi:MAG TPA: hypothetical protein VFM29_07855, partial [Vicinamibacteria bacterium]|nr:hypothetical protein [Vicinamibacteria bacterium]
IAGVYAVAGVLGAPRTLRAAILAAGGLAVVFPPLLVAAEAGRASGTVRAQAAWAEATPGRGRVLEMFPQSFRRDPARAPGADTWAPIPRPLGPLASATGVDPRVLTGVALVAAAILAARGAAGPGALVAAAAVAVTPAGPLGVLYGGGDSLLLLMLLLAWWLARRGRFTAGGSIAGAAIAAFPRALAAMPGTVLLRGASHTRVIGAALLVAMALAGSMLALGRGSLVPTVPVDPVAGIGLPNVALYYGLWSPPLAWVLVILAVIGGAFAWRLSPPAADDRGALAIAAAGILAVLWFIPGGSAHDLLAPIALLAIAACPMD